MTRAQAIQSLREYSASLDADPSLTASQRANMVLSKARKLDIGILDLEAELFGECRDVPFEVTTSAATEHPHDAAVKRHLATIRQSKGPTQ